MRYYSVIDTNVVVSALLKRNETVFITVPRFAVGGHFFLYRSADRFYLENIVEYCVNFPIRENLVTKSTKVARLGKFK